MPESSKAPMAPPDRISALPDAVLSHVLSFLQAREAVRSCVLARRWIHLWRSLPVLRVTGGPAEESREFMEHLLILRDRSPPDACVLKFDLVSDDDVRCVLLWIRYALLCQVRVLNVAFRRVFNFFAPLSSTHLPSQNLTELKIEGVSVRDKLLDFSSFPALEELKMTGCFIRSACISSRSLKSLSILDCYFGDTRTRIAAPNLVSLQLISPIGATPLLEDMAGLVTAVVTIDSKGVDSREELERELVVCDDASCECCQDTEESCGDACCECCYDPDGASNAGCVLLNGLSAATNLKLIAKPDVFILERDLRHCPTFSNLKTLFLNEWCLNADQRALICILQHSPALENLTLQLSETPEHRYPMKTTYNILEQPFASENLMKVEVTCQDVNQRVQYTIMSLSTYGIPLEKIYIRQTNKSSVCFNFVCTSFSSKQGGEDLVFISTKCLK